MRDNLKVDVTPGAMHAVLRWLRAEEHARIMLEEHHWPDDVVEYREKLRGLARNMADSIERALDLDAVALHPAGAALAAVEDAAMRLEMMTKALEHLGVAEEVPPNVRGCGDA